MLHVRNFAAHIYQQALLHSSGQKDVSKQTNSTEMCLIMVGSSYPEELWSFAEQTGIPGSGVTTGPTNPASGGRWHPLGRNFDDLHKELFGLAIADGQKL